jgi:hypothetical protein
MPALKGTPVGEQDNTPSLERLYQRDGQQWLATLDKKSMSYVRLVGEAIRAFANQSMPVSCMAWFEPAFRNELTIFLEAQQEFEEAKTPRGRARKLWNQEFSQEEVQGEINNAEAAQVVNRRVFIGILCYGGEGGIRTPDTLLGCNCLAGSPVRPLQHLSAATKNESTPSVTSNFS